MSFPKKPFVALGATYKAHCTKMDGSGESQVDRPDGPEFPVTAAARNSPVTEENPDEKSVIDHGTVEETPLHTSKGGE